MALLRVSLGFASAADHVLEETAGAVLGGLYANAGVYPAPTVAKADLQSALTAFTDTIAAASQGGTQTTAARDQARGALILLLRQLALYVQTVIQGNVSYGLAELLLSGFDAVSTNRTQQPLATPSITRIDNTGAGELTLRASAIPNARAYKAQYQTLPNKAIAALADDPPGPWTSAGLFSSTRGLAVTGLTPGQLYNFRLKAIGGLTVESDWSDTVSHMSL
ncbi:MAG: fibronectin type III domain-containing protein [Verrucomicrobia bacterium]|nr:fibronectin type III domain-containing protein [Verrucomicrobiota bacterium]